MTQERPTLMPLSKDELTFFVPILLVNELNVREAHWRPRDIRARTHREATAVAVLQALRTGGMRWEIEAPPEQPKVVHIVAHVRRLFDTHENLRAACKHLVDGLQDAGLIQDDGPHTGHVFTYEQIVDRDRLGAEVTVRLRDKTLQEDAGGSSLPRVPLTP
jgi:hypothetical protein